MRNFKPGRSFGSPKANDISYLIAEKPTTVSVYRRAGGSRADTAHDDLIATFTGRIDSWRNSQRDWRVNDAAIETDSIFLLTTYFSVDPLGRPVAFEVKDEVRVDSDTYLVVSKTTEPSVKHEGTLVLREP
jgi:hypothetical protein